MALLLHLPFATVEASSTPDTSGNGNNGTLVPGSGTGPLAARGIVPDLPGIHTLLVAGSPSYVSCPAAASPLGNAFTVAMWVKFETVAVRNAIWSTAGDSGSAGAPFIEINSSSLQMQLNTPGLYRCNAVLPGGHDLTKWHHYAWSRTGTNSNQAYLDSVPITTNSPNDGAMASTWVTRIGTRYDPGALPGLPSDAVFSDVRVYDGPLTAAEIRAIFCKVFASSARLGVANEL